MLVVPGFIDSHIHFLLGGLGLVVGATARRGDAGGVRAAHRRVRSQRVRRARGSETAIGITSCGAGSCRVATGSTRDTPRSSRVGQSARRPHVAGEQRRASRGGHHARHAGRRRRNDRARRERRTDRHPQGQRAVARRSRRAAAERRGARRRARRGDAIRREPRRDVGASHGHVGRSRACSSARTRAGRLATRIYAAVPIDTWERLRDRVASTRSRRRSGFASARSRDSSTARSARTPRRCSSRSTTRRTIAACSSTRRTISTRGRKAPTRAGLHLIVHAIGDLAIRTQLDIYERVIARERPARSAISHRARAAPARRRRSALRARSA